MMWTRRLVAFGCRRDALVAFLIDNQSGEGAAPTKNATRRRVYEEFVRFILPFFCATFARLSVSWPPT